VSISSCGGVIGAKIWALLYVLQMAVSRDVKKLEVEVIR